MFFATTASGLEPLLVQELRRLGASAIRPGSAGVSFTGDKTTMIRGCLRLRTAHRVLWTLDRFKANSAEALYDGVRRAARWQHLIDADRTFSIWATVRNAAVGDQRFVMLKVKDAIVDAVRDATGTRPSVDAKAPDVRVAVRWVGQDVTVSLDAAGVSSLAARGYRTEAGEAPLRETLAAGLLEMAGYRGHRPLIDPFCGSGTIPIEAALIARRIDPGRLRPRFGFETWPGHRVDKYRSIKAQSMRVELGQDVPCAPIWGLDLDQTQLSMAASNAQRAGVAEFVSFDRMDAKLLELPEGVSGPGLIVGNPPYGQRIGRDDPRGLEPLFRAFGEQLREHFSGWDVWLLLAEPEHAEAIGLKIVDKRRLMNGPLEIRAVHFQVP